MADTMDALGARPPRSSKDVTAAITRIVYDFYSEVEPQGAAKQDLRLSSHLEHDLGIDSIGRLELARRIYNELELTAHQQRLGTAKTLRDLIDIFTGLHNVPSSYKSLSTVEKDNPAVIEHRVSTLDFHSALYTGYSKALFALVMAPLWLGLMITPRLRWRRLLVHHTSRLLLSLARLPLRVDGLEHLGDLQNKRHDLPHAEESKLHPTGPVIVAANHASYLDGIVMAAALPPNFLYVVKRELENSFLRRSFLNRIGAIFVERFEPIRAAQQSSQITSALLQGESIVLFPEGTFYDSPGLRPFRMGSFVAATQANVPIVPVVIRGTRAILCGDDPLLRRGEIRVTICRPLRGEGSSWATALALRSAVRTEILRRCGEPDLSNQARFIR